MSYFDDTMNEVLPTPSDHGVSINRLLGAVLALAFAVSMTFLGSGSIIAFPNSVPSL